MQLCLKRLPFLHANSRSAVAARDVAIASKPMLRRKVPGLEHANSAAHPYLNSFAVCGWSSDRCPGGRS
jgi:hypothetical protein